MTKIGFIGLGAMGWLMANNLIKAGYELAVFDANTQVAAKFATQVGGHASGSLVELGAWSQVVITMLPTSKIVSSVLFDEGGFASQLPRGAVLIDMTSGVPAATVEIARRLHLTGVEFLDAPVSGGTRRALTAELSIMVGGDKDTLERVRQVLEAMGKTIVHTGRTGSGQAMKALNNLALAGSLLIAVEALLVGKKFGLDPELIVDVFNSSSGMNYNTQAKFKQFMLSQTYAAGFSLDLLAKDVGIAVGLAREMEAEVPFSSVCESLWNGALQTLGTGHDHTEIIKVSAQLAGVDFP